MTKQWKPEIRAHRALREPLVITLPGGSDLETDAAVAEAATRHLLRTSKWLRRPVVLVLGNAVKPVCGK